MFRGCLARVAGAILSAATLALAGCGGSDTAPPPAASNPRVSATIGTTGGTLTGPDGVQMVVPAGAVAQDTVFSIARVTSGMPALPTDYTTSGPVYEFTPHDQPFAQPVTVKMPYTAPANAQHADVFMASPGGDWQSVQPTVANGVAQWQRVSLSYGTGLFCVSSGPPDPYMCVWPTLGVRVAATPVRAYTESTNAFGVRIGSLIEAATLQFTLDASAARDCGATGVTVFRRNGTAPSTTVLTQSISLANDPNSVTRMAGSTAFSLAFDRPDNGTVFLTFKFNCTRPGHAQSGASLQMQLGVNVPPSTNAAPVITAQPASQAVTAPTAATFSAAASGTPAPTVQWQQSRDNGTNWTDIAGATSPTYTTAPTTVADTGLQFRAVFTNGVNVARSNAAVLTVNAPTNAAVAEVTAGETFSCARHVDGAVRCWGTGIEGSLGYEDMASRGGAPGEMGANLPVVNLGTGRTARAIASGNRHTCALLDNNQLKCWGVNTYGQAGVLGNNYVGRAPGDMGDNLPPVDLGTGVAVQALSLGGLHSCALLNGGRVKCWGNNLNGQLGTGDSRDTHGIDGGDMGDALPFVNLGTGRTAVAVATGRFHTCAILDNGTVKCWGYGRFGALGVGDQLDRGRLASDLGDNLQAVALGTGRTAVALAAGEQWTCALLDNATVKCWGDNTWGQLGRGDTLAFTDTLARLGDALPTVNLGTGRTVTALRAGHGHACAFLDNGQVKCWGENFFGGLGLGDTRNRGLAASDLGDNLPPIDMGTGRGIVQFATRYNRNCVLLDNGAVKCWGDSYPLGVGDGMIRGDDPGEMGDALPAIDLSR